MVHEIKFEHSLGENSTGLDMIKQDLQNVGRKDIYDTLICYSQAQELTLNSIVAFMKGELDLPVHVHDKFVFAFSSENKISGRWETRSGLGYLVQIDSGEFPQCIILDSHFYDSITGPEYYVKVQRQGENPFSHNIGPYDPNTIYTGKLPPKISEQLPSLLETVLKE